MHIIYYTEHAAHILPTAYTIAFALGAAYGCLRLVFDAVALFERIRLDPPKDKQRAAWPTEWRRGNGPTKPPADPPAGP